MQTFNVGDKVKVVKLDNRTWVEVRKRLGQIGTVIKPDPTDCQIEFQDGKRFFFRYCELEKVEESFKIDEEVYANVPSLGFVNEKVTIFTINQFDIAVKSKEGLIYCFDPKCISKQPINTKNLKTEKIMNKTPKQIDSEIDNLKAQIAKLEKEKEEQSFRVGDWFKVVEDSNNDDYKVGGLYEIVKIEKEFFGNDHIATVRFHENGVGETNRYNLKFAIKATPAEIKAHLIKLAEESGLKIGEEARKTLNYLAPAQRTIVKFKLYSLETKNSNSIGCNGYLEKNKLKYGLAIRYNNGFCSYPFDYITYLQNKFQPKITINGYDAEFHSGFVSFGCAKFENIVFTRAQEFLKTPKGENTNRTVEHIKMGAGIFTPTDIENIVKWLKN